MKVYPVFSASLRQWLLIGLVYVLLPTLHYGQAIYSNTFTGTGACPTQGNVPTVSTNATGTPLSRNTLTCNSTADVFNSSTLNGTSSVNDASYIEFSVIANANAQLNVGSLSFFRQASNTAPNQLEVRYSTNNFASSTSWGAAPNTPTTGSLITWDFADFSVPPGTTVTFRFYPYGTQKADLTAGPSNGSTGTFRLDNITLSGTSPLPVNLVSFTGKYSQNGVTLTWITAWEEGNQGFDILKSANAKSFESVGAVAGKYNAQGQSVYAFTDQNVIPGQIYYYRLKQNDVGGESTLSQIIAVLAEATAQSDKPVVSPNPNKGSFTLLGQEQRPADVKLYSPSGVEVSIDTEAGKGDKALDIRARTFLLPGVYYLHVKPADGTKTNALKVLIEP